MQYKSLYPAAALLRPGHLFTGPTSQFGAKNLLSGISGWELAKAWLFSDLSVQT